MSLLTKSVTFAAVVLAVLGLSILLVRTDVLPADALRLLPPLYALGGAAYLGWSVFKRSK